MRERLEPWADYLGGVGLALFAATGILYFLQQPVERLLVLLGIGVVLIAVYFYARPQVARDLVAKREARHGTNTLVVSIAFIGLVALLNFLSLRYNARYDLTASKSQSLSELTVNVLKDLKEPVQATAFYTTIGGGQGRQEAEDRLKDYARHTDKFTYRIVDPQAEPFIANDYKVQFDGTIVFERGTRRENALSSDEQSLTNALMKVAQDTQAVIYFTTGHGERSPDDTGENGYSLARARLEAFNFKFGTLNLRTVTETLPSDLTALVIAGPRQRFDAEEVTRVREYLSKGGRVLIMVDPQSDFGLESLLKEWGISFRNDHVIDPTQSFPGRPTILVINAYKGHLTTQDLVGFTTILPNARSLATEATPPTGRFASALFAASANAWGETNFDSLRTGNPTFDANSDVKGPLDLAYAVDAPGEKAARLVAIGNSTFLTNSILRALQGTANEVFVIGIMNWLAGQENLIAIPPKPPTTAPILLSNENALFVFLSSFVMLPGAMLLLGVLVWWRRR